MMIQIGDMILLLLFWMCLLCLGGVQWCSNFGLCFDFVMFLVFVLFGSVVVLMLVDLYVNNVCQFSGDVLSGLFVINSVLGIIGVGNVMVVMCDVFGCLIVMLILLYVDMCLLVFGFVSYLFEVGFLCCVYGIDLFDYVCMLVVSGLLCYGISEWLIVEVYGEVMVGVYNVGVGVFVCFGECGVVNVLLVFSVLGRIGVQVGVGYQYVMLCFLIDVQMLCVFGDYVDLGSCEGVFVLCVIDCVMVLFLFLCV